MATTSGLTPNQRAVLVKVANTNLQGQRYRAESSGERVTLASLYRHRLLIRWAWRGQEGEADAAHEYALPAYVQRELRAGLKEST
jgi:hypothetical protein